MFRLALIACALLAWAGAASPQGPFGDAKRWAERLDHPERIATQRPDEVVRLLALAPDAVVADIGAGTGFFAVRLAKAVPRGRVYAVDIEPAMVAHLVERARLEGLANLFAGLATTADPQLPEPVDVAFLANVHGLFAQPGDYYRTLARALKPSGRVVIIAARPGSPGAGPPESIRTPPERVQQDMAQAGFRLAAEHALLPGHYFLEFLRAE